MDTTPHLDTLRCRLAKALTARGQQAELSRHLAATYHGAARSYRVLISDFTASRAGLGGELALAISQWLDGHQPPARRRARAGA